MANDFHDELTEQELALLTAALASLPADLAFLREPILDIASQDQDLLGCGEADTSKLAEALADQLRADLDLSVTSIVQLLRKWTRKVAATGNDAWCGPIHFVMGFLKGAEWYTIEELTAPMPKPPERGLFRITMDIPANAKATFLVGGVQIKIRGVEIDVIEESPPWVSDDELLAEQPPVPNVRRIIDNELRIGGAIAKRLSLKNLDNGRVQFVQYQLSFPELLVQAMIFTQRGGGFDLAQYEPILASIRPKEPRTK